MIAYLAAAYSRKPEIAIAAERLEAFGIKVISSWHKERYNPKISIKSLNDNALASIAGIDLNELALADTLIFWAEPHDSQPPRGGRHVEFGIALAYKKHIIVIGERENIFHYFPGITCVNSLEDIINAAA